MSGDSTFLAFERHLKRATGESVVTIEAAYDPWENEIDEMDQRLGFTKPMAAEEDDELIRAKARAFRELILFCFEKVVLEPDGRIFQAAIRRFVAVAHSFHPGAMRTGQPLRKPKGPVIGATDLARLAHTSPSQLEMLAGKSRVRIEMR